MGKKFWRKDAGEDVIESGVVGVMVLALLIFWGRIEGDATDKILTALSTVVFVMVICTSIANIIARAVARKLESPHD